MSSHRLNEPLATFKMQLHEAQNIAEKLVLSKQGDFSLNEGLTQEFPGCFAFYYQNREYIKSQEFSLMSVGAGPILVCKRTGNSFETGTAYSTEHYVHAFESCGDPFGTLTENIKVFGWEVGGNKVAATKLIRSESGLNLKESKGIIDFALKNQESTFSTVSVQKSTEVAKKLAALGFKCKQLWSNGS